MLPLLADTKSIDSTSTVLIGVGVAGLLYVWIIRPMMRKRSDPLDRAPGYASLAQQRATERQMQSLLVDLSEMARQISSQLDTRAAKLEALIRQADERLAALRQAQNGMSEMPPAPPRIDFSVEPSVVEAPPRVVEPVPEELPFPEPLDPAHERIYRLADEGRTSGDIATEMSRPKGEIELILALRGK